MSIKATDAIVLQNLSSLHGALFHPRGRNIMACFFIPGDENMHVIANSGTLELRIYVNTLRLIPLLISDPAKNFERAVEGLDPT